MADEVPEWLYGFWVLQRAEPGLELQDGTRIEFRDAGELRYTIPLDGKEARFELEYVVEGAYLSTRHADGGHVNRMRFAMVRGELLEFDFSGKRAWFRRERLM